MQTSTQTTPRIYVACLAAYNNGFLHGCWIDADQGKEGIWDDIHAMLKASPIPLAEEWAIHDYEGFEGLSLSEYEDLDRVVELAELIEEFGEAWSAYANHVGVDYATKEGFEEAYQGQWDSEEAFAEELADEVMEIPERLQFYFDYEKFAHELFMTDYFSVKGDSWKVYVFRNL